MKTINYAIDLGTTNSLIAKYTNGTVEVFKNPYGLKENLPSVVGFRGERVLVGDKAKEYLEKDPENVFACFKRKMGTVDSYWAPNISKTITPIELSTIVLNELKNFVRSDSVLESMVITIPASFDTIQSNATKKAGYAAGFKEVALLQEPIAACLAAANKSEIPPNKKWLVYDFGGGTFDVAVVQNDDTELKVVDHKGDNFLGGMDFDRAMVEKIILPKVYQNGNFNNIQQGEKILSKEYQRLFFVLANKAEEAKIELSNQSEAFIDFEVTDDNGDEIDITFTITRGELNEVVFTKVMRSIELVRELLESNNLKNEDIDRLVLVGGTTYIPLVREMLTQHLGIPLDTSVDPTNAIAVGGAYYAGNKLSENSAIRQQIIEANSNSIIKLKTSYLKSTRELEEMVIGVFEGLPSNSFVRINREDKGFDSGLKPILDFKFTEILRLNPKTINRFYVSVFNDQQQLIQENIGVIEISHGTYNVTGQPLPNDICIEVDDLLNNRTKLEVIFEKNSILPLRKKIYKEVSRTIYKSGTENLIINILEGDKFASPSTNQVIGCVEIKALALESDLVRGSDVEVSIEISESRDITVKAFLSINDQQFENVFSPSEKYVSIQKLQDELDFLMHSIKKDIQEFQKKEEYEIAQELENMRIQALEVRAVLSELSEEDTTDLRYQLEERKRSIAQKYDTLEKNKKLTHIISEYYRAKEWVEYQIEKEDNIEDKHKHKLDNIIKDETTFLKEKSILLIESKTQDLWDLWYDIARNQPTYWIDRYYSLQRKNTTEFTNENQAKQLLGNGQDALTRQNYKELEIIVKGLWSLLPQEKGNEMKIKGTGLM